MSFSNRALHTLDIARQDVDNDTFKPAQIVVFYGPSAVKAAFQIALLDNELRGELPEAMRTGTTYDWRTARTSAQTILSDEAQNTFGCTLWDLCYGELAFTSSDAGQETIVLPDMEFSVPEVVSHTDTTASHYKWSGGALGSWAWWLQVGMFANSNRIADVSAHKSDQTLAEAKYLQRAEIAWSIAEEGIQSLAVEWLVAKRLHALFAPHTLQPEADPMTATTRATARALLDAIPVAQWTIAALDHLMPTQVKYNDVTVSEIPLPMVLLTDPTVVEQLKAGFVGEQLVSIFALLHRSYYTWVEGIIGRVKKLAVNHTFFRDFFPQGAPSPAAGSLYQTSAGPHRQEKYNERKLIISDGYNAMETCRQDDFPYTTFVEPVLATRFAMQRKPLVDYNVVLPYYVPPQSELRMYGVVQIDDPTVFRDELPADYRTPYTKAIYNRRTFIMKYNMPIESFGLALKENQEFYTSNIFLAQRNGYLRSGGMSKVDSYVAVNNEGIPVAPPAMERKILDLSPTGDLTIKAISTAGVLKKGNESALDLKKAPKRRKLIFLFENLSPDLFVGGAGLYYTRILGDLPVY